MGSGDPMFGRNVRRAALATAAVGVLALAGCSAGDPVASAPPPSDHGKASTPPELMGAPPPSAAPAQDGLLGGPVSDASAQAQAEAKADAAQPAPSPPPPTHNSHLKTWRRPDGTLVTAMRPIPNPKTAPRAASAPPKRVQATIQTQAAPAKPVAVAAVKPVTPKTVAPAPLKAAQPAMPAAPLAKPPVVAAAPPVAAAKPATKLEQLQAAVAPAATNGAVLATGESLSKGQPGQVTLSLPATLGDLIKKEAAKLGLTKAADKTSAYADLQGEGYEITPNGRQTAVVKPGEPTTFAWQVKPGPEAKGELKSQFGVELTGDKAPQGLSLGEISKRVAALPETAKKGMDKLDLGALNGSISLPGVGPTPIKTLLGAALVLLALIILVAVARSAAASRRRAEQQRKYRTLTDYGRNEMEFDAPPASTHVAHVNPFLAAAGGAAAGAVAASAVSHHDDHHDHAPGHDDHAGHDHPGHGHDDHGHDDHGHGHDLHAHAHPEPHAPAEHVAYVNPMVAAASANHHDDHGHGHDDHGHGHDDHGHGHDDHGHDAHDDHGHGDHGHDHGAHDDHHAHAEHASHGNPAHVSPAATLTSHSDDHGHSHDDHEHDAHGDHGHGHDDHAHGPDHGAHDDHHGDHHPQAEHASHVTPAATPTSHGAEHGHGHDDHSHGHDEHGAEDHGHDPHGHAGQGHHDDHGHGHKDEHHKELEHAHH